MSRFLLRGRVLIPGRDLSTAMVPVVDKPVDMDHLVLTRDLRVRLTLAAGRVVHA